MRMRHDLLAPAAAALLLACSKAPDRPGPAPAAVPQGAAASVAAPAEGQTVVLATLGDEKAPETPVGSGLGFHPQVAGGEFEFIFAERGGGVAWAAQAGEGARVLYDGRPGKAYDQVNAISLSPDGRRIAYAALSGRSWREVVDGVEGPPFGAVGRAVFSPDGGHVAYQAMKGERWLLVVDGKPAASTATRFLGLHAFDPSSARLAYVDDVDDRAEGGKLVVTELASGRRTVVDRRVRRMLPSADRSRLAAVSDSGGRQAVLALSLARPDVVERGAPADAVSELTLARDGGAVAYVATRGTERLLILGGREAPLPPGDVVEPPAIRLDHHGAGVLLAADGGVRLREFFTGEDRAGAAYEEAEGLVYGPGGVPAYAARRGTSWFVVVNGREGPPFDRVVTPVFAPDGRRVAYRARKDGRRFVVVCDLDGKTLRQHPAYEQVFPVTFDVDGRSIAYGVKDGRQLAWKVEPP